MKNPKQIGDYRIIERLGQGGMGIVYRAEDVDSGAIVALKTVRLPRQRFLHNIRREIYVLSRIDHPGIVRILDQGVHDGLPWYVMDYLDGILLRDFSGSTGRETDSAMTTGPGFGPGSGSGPRSDVSEMGTTAPQQDEVSQRAEIHSPESDITASGHHGDSETRSTVSGRELLTADARISSGAARFGGNHLTAKTALRIIRRLCEPLAFLHGEGIVHRDLKPGNILIRAEIQPIIFDFGMLTYFGGRSSRDLLDIEASSGGTAHYMAPEQIIGEVVDARADLYSLGCILYELLTGFPPFLKSSDQNILEAHLGEQAALPSTVVQGLTEEIDSLVMRLLEKNPSERIGYAEDVARICDGILGDSEPHVGPRPRHYLYRPGFNGRDRQFRDLSGNLNRLKEGKGSLVLIAGESGVGKTRFVLEFGTMAAREEILVMTGMCRANAGTPLQGFQGPLQFIGDLCRQLDQGTACRKLLGDRIRILSQCEPSLKDLIPESSAEEQRESLTAEFQNRLLVALWETINALIEQRRVLIIIDNLQWADDLTITFLERARRSSLFENRSLLIVGTYRTEEASPQLEQLAASSTTVIHLHSLDEESTKRMVRDMLAMQEPPSAFVTMLSRHAEGNPFFVAEYMKAALQENILERDESGFWRITADVTEEKDRGDVYILPLPKSVRELVERRLTGRDTKLQRFIEVLAVLGREADFTLVQSLTGFDESTSFSITAELLRRQVLQDTGTQVIRFAHAQFRDIAYDRIDEIERQELHHRAAVILEEMHRQGSQPFYKAICQHWNAAGDVKKACDYAMLAARSARDNYLHTDAEYHYRYVIAHTTNAGDTVIEVMHELAMEVLQLQGKNDEALTILLQALALTADSDDPISRKNRGMTLCMLGRIYHRIGQLGDARQALVQALKISRESGNVSTQAQALANLGILFRQQGQFQQALSLFEQALTLYRTSGDTLNESSIVNSLAVLFYYRGDFKRARQLYEQALNLIRESSNLTDEGTTLCNLAIIHESNGDYEDVVAFYEQSLAADRRIGNRESEGRTLYNLAVYFHWSIGDVDRAAELYEEALFIAQTIGNRRSEGLVLAGIASLIRQSGGSLERACEIADRAENVLRQIGVIHELCVVLCVQGHLNLAKGSSAREMLDSVRRIADDVSVQSSSPLGHYIASLSRAQDAFEQNKQDQLFRGDHIDDIPPGIRSWQFKQAPS